MRAFIALALLAATSALAQKTPQQRIEAEANRSLAMELWRVQHMNAVNVAQANEEIRRLRAEIADLKAKCGDACKPKDEAKK